jgi:hypothetical protein
MGKNITKQILLKMEQPFSIAALTMAGRMGCFVRIDSQLSVGKLPFGNFD